jgi:Mor family transcriptional regulator
LSYKNGKELLPERLLKEIQEYIQGELIYIPREENVRKAWGTGTGTREYMNARNNEIYTKYKNGSDIDYLMAAYNLCEDSIIKIVKIKGRENKL